MEAEARVVPGVTSAEDQEMVKVVASETSTMGQEMVEVVVAAAEAVDQAEVRAAGATPVVGAEKSLFFAASEDGFGRCCCSWASFKAAFTRVSVGVAAVLQH